MTLQRRSGAAGLALLPVVLVLLTVGSIAFLLNHQAAMHTEIAAHSAGLDEARYVAEAGLAHELWRLQQADCAGYTPLAATAFGDHGYEASVTPASGTPVTIEAKATLAGGETHSLTRQRTVYSAPKTDDLQPGSAASQDTYLADGGAANDNFEQALQMLVGDGLNDEHALLRFDLSGLPAGARLSSAVLELNLESVGFSGSGTASVHRVTQGWLAPSATWNQYTPSLPWVSPGGDYETTPIASASVDDTLPGPVQWDITGLVKDWADATVPNEGLLLSASASTDDVTFTSSEGACTQRPKLTLTYACECGLPCQLAQATGPVCDGDYLPDANLGEFSTAALGASDIWDLSYLPECTTFNGVEAPNGGAWLLVDYVNDLFYMTNMAGTLLTSLATPSANELGVELIPSGLWAGHLAVTDETLDTVYFVDLAGAIQGSFSTASFTQHPVGVGFIASSAAGTWDNHLLISSDKDGSGLSNAAIYIVDQTGTLKNTIDVSGDTPQPWGVAHVMGTDKILVASSSGTVFVIDMATADYDAAALGGAGPQGIALNPRSGDHVLVSKTNTKVVYLNRYLGYRDEFNNNNYNLDDGPLSWSGNWQEAGENDGPGAGLLQVITSANCESTFCARIGGHQVNITGRDLSREADLSGFTSAILSFSYRRALTGGGNGGSVILQVSANGGGSWTSLQSYPLTASDVSQVPQSFDITPYISANTQIRFLGAGAAIECNFHIDNVWIQPGECVSP